MTNQDKIIALAALRFGEDPDAIRRAFGASEARMIEWAVSQGVSPERAQEAMAAALEASAVDQAVAVLS
jgi:hypothetical protein